jgi:hypothetical protein
MAIISEDVLYQRSNYREILQGDLHRVIEEGNKTFVRNIFNGNGIYRSEE